MGKIYPLTVTPDRYSGTYSGGKWLAFNLLPGEVHPRVHGNDLECSFFWEYADKTKIGLGDTPEEAIKNLEHKLQIRGIV
jgi:hypothetical protein